jgi:rhombotail lipoprotein
MRGRTLLLTLVVLCGCTGFYSPQHRHYRSNLVDYLFPGGMSAPPRSGARLQLPLKVGIAFVPGEPPTVDPQQEQHLLGIVRKAFTGRDWIEQIQVIPSAYLTPRGGYENLEQVAQLMNVDVIALVSVDQIQYSDPTALSILYLSIVGEYLLPGDRNDTRTMIDVAAVAVRSHAFLLRAPGTSRIGGMATPIESDRVLRSKSAVGMQLAMVDLTKNLDREIGSFKATIVSGERSDVDIYTREGKSIRGGGAFDAATMVMVLAIAVALFVPMRKRS